MLICIRDTDTKKEKNMDPIKIAGIVGGGASLVGEGLNYFQQQQQLKYMKEAQKTTWNREDNAAQRRVADLKAAGLSPTLAAGSAASTSAPIKVNAPQVNSQAVSQATQNAMNLLQQKQNIAKTKAEINYTNAQADKARSEANVLQGTETQRIETAISQNKYLKDSLQDRLNTVIRQAETATHTRDSAEAKAQVDQLDASWKQQLENYLTETSGRWTEHAKYISNNPYVMNQMILALDQELKNHDIGIYKKLPFPSGVLGNTINATTGLVGRAIR